MPHYWWTFYQKMGGIELQLLHGVRIELAIGSLPYLAVIPSKSPPYPLGVLKVPLEEERVLQTCQPLGLEVESRTRDNPSLD